MEFTLHVEIHSEHTMDDAVWVYSQDVTTFFLKYLADGFVLAFYHVTLVFPF